MPKSNGMAVKVVKAPLVWSILFGMQTGWDEHFYCDGIAGFMLGLATASHVLPPLSLELGT